MAVYRTTGGKLINMRVGRPRPVEAPTLPRPDDVDVSISYDVAAEDENTGHFLTVNVGEMPEGLGISGAIVRVDGQGFDLPEGSGTIKLAPTSVARQVQVGIAYRSSTGATGPMAIRTVWQIPPGNSGFNVPQKLTATLINARKRVVATSGGWYTMEITAQPGDPHYDATEIRWFQASGNTNPPQPAETSTGPTVRRTDEGTTRVWRFAAATFGGANGHERQAGGSWATCNLLYKTQTGINPSTGLPIISALGPISESFSWAAPAATGTAPVVVSVSVTPASPKVGDTLTVAVTVTGNPTPTVAYEWTKGATDIAGATSTTLSTASGYAAGDSITASVTATNANGTATKTSTPVVLAAATPAAQPAAALLADWAIVGEVTDGTKKTLYLCTTAAGAYSADADAMWWTNWTTSEQVYPFECVEDGTVPSGTHVGRKRFKLTGTTNGAETEYHLRGPGEKLDNIGILVRLTPTGLRSPNPASTQRRDYTFAGTAPTVPAGDLPDPDVTVGTASALLSAMAAVGSNLNTTYRIGLLPGSYGAVTVPTNYSKGTTKVVLQATAPATTPNSFPLFTNLKLEGAKNVRVERARMISTSKDGYGFPNAASGYTACLGVKNSSNCEFVDLYLQGGFYGIESNSTKNNLYDYITIVGCGNDLIRHYSTTAAPNADNIFRRLKLTPHMPANTFPALGTIWGSYTFERSSAIDPRRNDSDGWKSGDGAKTGLSGALKSIDSAGAVTIANLAGTNASVSRQTLKERHADGIQMNGPATNTLIEDCEIIGWNGYYHSILAHNEASVNPNQNTGLVIRRVLSNNCAVHAIQISRNTGARVEQCLIRKYSPATWSTGPGSAKGQGYMMPCVSIDGQTTSTKVTVTNVVMPVGASSNPQWDTTKATVSNVVFSDTAVPTGWSTTAVALGKIGFLGWRN